MWPAAVRLSLRWSRCSAPTRRSGRCISVSIMTRPDTVPRSGWKVISVRKAFPLCGWCRCKRIGTRICARNKHKGRQNLSALMFIHPALIVHPALAVLIAEAVLFPVVQCSFPEWEGLPASCRRFFQWPRAPRCQLCNARRRQSRSC